MRPKTKLFIVLWLAGMAGILSFLLVDLNAILKDIDLFKNLPQKVEVP